MTPNPADINLDDLETVVLGDKPSPMCTAGYRHKAVRLAWIIRIAALAFLVGGLVVGIVEGRWYALGPGFVLVVLAWVGSRMRFCPDCDAVTRYRLSGLDLTFCASCGRLVRPERVRVGPTGVVDLNDRRTFEHPEPAVRLVCIILLVSLKDRATEVRIEPDPDDVRLRYRCGGELYEMVPAPGFMRKSIGGVLRTFAGMDLAAKTKQFGQLELRSGPASVLARIEVSPSELGDQVTLWLPELHGDARPDTTLVAAHHAAGGGVSFLIKHEQRQPTS